MAWFGWRNIVRTTLTASETSVFANSDSSQVGIKEIEFVNKSSGSVNVYLYLADATLTNKHALVFNEEIKKNGRWKWNGWKVLENNGDKILAYASVSGVVELFVDGGQKR